MQSRVASAGQQQVLARMGARVRPRPLPEELQALSRVMSRMISIRHGRAGEYLACYLLEAYADLEASGNLKIFTARDGSALVGYFVVFVRNHIHYKDHLFAHNDILFLSEPYRKGFTGIKLIKFAEECLKVDGVSVLTINTKTHKPFDGVLQRLGFNHVENIYSKLLRS